MIKTATIQWGTPAPFRQLPREYFSPTTPASTSSYDCVEGECVDPGDGSGAYSSLVACEAECGVESYDCIDGECIDPGDGSGEYATLEECEAECGESFNCVDDECVDPGDGSGIYDTLEDCQAVCYCPADDAPTHLACSFTGTISMTSGALCGSTTFTISFSGSLDCALSFSKDGEGNCLASCFDDVEGDFTCPGECGDGTITGSIGVFIRKTVGGVWQLRVAFDLEEGLACDGGIDCVPVSAWVTIGDPIGTNTIGMTDAVCNGTNTLDGSWEITTS